MMVALFGFSRIDAGRDIYAVAVYGAVRSFDDFPEIDPDAKAHPACFRQRFVALCQHGLDFRCRAHSSRGCLEHCEHAVARHIHDTAVMSLNLCAEDGAVRFEARHGGFVVLLHKARITSDTGSEYRAELTDSSFWFGH